MGWLTCRPPGQRAPGEAGPAGPRGQVGPAGPAGGDVPDTAEQIRDKLLTVDGAGLNTPTGSMVSMRAI